MAGVVFDLTGKRFGKLIVVEKSVKRYSNNRGVHWLCRCDCGKETCVLSWSLRSGRTNSCGCYGRTHAWKGYKEISSSYWSVVKRGAKMRKLPFKINIKFAWELFEKQEKKCALSGLPIDFTRDRRKTKQTASLDRINNKKGYTKDNVQWVHKDVNWLKQDFDQEYFFQLCEAVAKHWNLTIQP